MLLNAMSSMLFVIGTENDGKKTQAQKLKRVTLDRAISSQKYYAAAFAMDYAIQHYYFRKISLSAVHDAE